MNAPAIILPKLGYRRREAADLIGISPTTFDAWVKEGKLPQPRRIGGIVLWRADELQAAFDRLTGADTGRLNVPASEWSGRL